MSATRFHCVICGSALHAPSDSRADVMECPNCRRHVPIPNLLRLPERPAGCVPVLPADVLELALKFECTECRRRLRIDARWEGRTIQCPACDRETRIPRWSTVPWPVRAEKPSPPEPVRLSDEEVDFLKGTEAANSGAAA
jgi:DNA-directed RNA polymerase subunit RPC12/RpoP